jgi:membrane fusion protein (multidrug efflux system)
VFHRHLPPRRSSAPSRTALALCGCVLLAGCGGADAAPGEEGGEATPVVVRALAQVDRPDYVGLSGDVEGWSTANIGFLVPGQVRLVALREGQLVEQGQLMAELDPTEYQLNLDMATAQRERAEQEYARAGEVFKQRGIPENDLQKAETAVKLGRAGEAMARKKLADTRIPSPLTGVVARRGVEPGEIVGPGIPVFTVVQINPVQVRVGVPETDIDRFAVGQRATVSIPSLGGAIVDGRVRVVGIAADPASRTYMVKIELPNPNHRIRPGMIAEVRVENDLQVQARTIPAEAVVRDADGITRVFVYEPAERRVHARRIEVGAAYGTEIEVRSGLTGDELVVVGGQNRLREGALVQARVDSVPALVGETDDR